MSNIIQPTHQANTPAILTPTSGDTVISSDTSRISWSIQNLGTNPLFVRFGASATTAIFHIILQGGTVSDDGTGGFVSQTSGIIFSGDISVAGTGPRLTTYEVK